VTYGSNHSVIRIDPVSNPQSTEVLRPEHAVSEGLMTWAEDKRPEETLLIGLSQYRFQRHTSG